MFSFHFELFSWDAAGDTVVLQIILFISYIRFIRSFIIFNGEILLLVKTF